MITIHTPLISSSTDSIKEFLSAVKENSFINKEENIVVQFVEGKVILISPLKSLTKDPKDVKEPKDTLSYDGLTAIKFYGGSGFALLDAGKETNLKNFNKTEVTKWAKSHWIDGILVNWEEVSSEGLVANSKAAITATRASYDWE